MKIIRLKKYQSEDHAIKHAVALLKKVLKKGDIIATKPRLKNIKVKLRHFPSLIISKLSRGVTHSCLYLGRGYVLEIGTSITDTKIKKFKLERLLKSKIRMFKGVTVYVIQPKRYKNHHRHLVFKIAINNFLKKSRSIVFSYWSLFKLWVNLILKKYKFAKKENLRFKKDWNCSELVAYVLKKAGIKVGNRRTTFFLPATFVFSQYFKTKEKVVLK